MLVDLLGHLCGLRSLITSLESCYLAGFLLFSPGIDITTITSNQVALLGWGTTLSVVVQALVLVPVIRKLGISIKPKLGVSGLGKSFNLAGWTLVYVLISQLGYLVTVNVATSAAVRSAQDGVETGVGYTPYTFAYFVMLLPYSIITIFNCYSHFASHF
jgi:putative peptidoglycan lipid II flippase